MSERTAVAIVRALVDTGSRPRVLILDEPTANLPASEAQRLYALCRQVAKRGLAVMFVSHHFDEVFELADTVTVLRDGKHLITRKVEGLTEDKLIELVVGRELDLDDHAGAAPAHGPVVLTARSVSGNVTHDVDLELRSGEIVGVAGITGSGRDEIAQMLFGGRRRNGEVQIFGVHLPPLRPDASMKLGMGLVPAERHANAAFLAATLRENVTLVNPGRHVKFGVLNKRAERSDVLQWLERLDVSPAKPEFTMASLSGGNQQKVVIARWLRIEPRVLILDEPTQGVDVGAKADIHVLIGEAAAQGTAVLVASTDHEELARLCHRVLIFRKGRIVEEISGPALTNDAITAATIERDVADHSTAV